MIGADGTAAFATVVLLDLVLAADNAIVVGALASGLPPVQRRKVIAIGTAAALVLRIAFALALSWLLAIPGVVLAGGLLLLVVAWRMWCDMGGGAETGDVRPAAHRGFWAAVGAVAVADASMSLDNVLAVAGAARAHPLALSFGLVLSVALMGLGASVVAGLIERHRWIGFVGLGLIIVIAGRMIWEGGHVVVASL